MSRRAALVLFACLGCCSLGVAAPLQLLQNHVPAAAARLQPIGRLSASNRLELTIGLPLRNRATLDQFRKDIYDPKSPFYHHYVTPQQFGASYGASPADYQKVIDYARKNGFQVATLYSNRLMLDISGTVENVEKAFHVTMRLYPHPTEARQFYAPDVEPTLDLDVPVAHIDGLDNYETPHPLYTPGCCGTGPLGGDLLTTYAGHDFFYAYVTTHGFNNSPLNGKGQNVGLLQFATYDQSDITAYEHEFSLPNVNISNVAVHGGTTSVKGEAEVCLDIEMVIAMAPHVSTVYVYEGSNAVQILGQMAQNTTCSQFSSSWQWGGSGVNEETLFIQMQTQGQSFFQAAGDTTAYTGDISYASDSPNVTVVGGTVLDMTLNFWDSEVVWNDGSYTTNHGGGYLGGGGGISTRYSIPSYQQGVATSANLGSSTMRNIPDVAAVAQDVWVTHGSGQSGSFAGTSVAAPLWAGYTALVNQMAAEVGHAPVGFLNPSVYAIGAGNGPDTYANCFHDVTSGNNESPNSPNAFPATTGYDLCTGWGTPTPALINALAGAANAYYVNFDPSVIDDPFPNGDQADPYYYLVDSSYIVDKPGALGRVPPGANIIFLKSGTESSSIVSGTGVSRVAQWVRLGVAPGVAVRLAP